MVNQEHYSLKTHRKCLQYWKGYKKLFASEYLSKLEDMKFILHFTPPPPEKNNGSSLFLVFKTFDEFRYFTE